MRTRVFIVAVVLTITTVAFGQSATKRYIYMSMPDAAQKEGRSGSGILVFDIDDGHKLVKRINVPKFEEGTRGFTANKASHSAYFSMSGGRVGRIDLETDKVVWDKTYDRGADRSSITMDGKKLYVPTGYWYAGEDAGLLVLNAENGEVIKRITVGPGAHNSIVSLDGRFLYLGTRTALTVFDTRDERVIHDKIETGESSIFPFTIDSRNRHAYVSLGTHIGFDVVDLMTGTHLHRIYQGSPQLIHARTHGAGLTPDETELWISDQQGRKLFIFDATKMPPTPKGHVELSQGGHGWVTFSLDGRYAYSHAPDIFDARTKQVVGTFKDEKGQPVSASKYIEIHFRDGKVVEVANEFGLGRRSSTSS
jgi:DNA-binding beta-propeller fold protein YncE